MLADLVLGQLGITDHVGAAQVGNKESVLVVVSRAAAIGQGI